MKKENLSEKLINIMRSKNYVPLSAHELALMLGLNRKDILKLKSVLAEMVKGGVVAKVKGDRYASSDELDLVSGTIDFRPSGRAYMRTAKGDVIEFRQEDTGVALNGDNVLARIIVAGKKRFGNARGAFGKKSKKNRYVEKNYFDDGTKYARVIRILERKNEKVIGTLRRSYNFWHVVPDDPKFFYDIIVADPAKSGLTPVPVENDKVVVKLNDWTQRHINPSGEIIENFGESHTPMAEYRAILSKYDLSETFPEDVEEEANNTPDFVRPKEVVGRCDMRGKFTITIDPVDAKDFDDAISLELDKDGEWEVGVHIADVSHYVRPNTALDKEAGKRGNSTYLVGTVIPMLPFALSNGICSLVEDQDRLVKSVFLKFDNSGNCKSARFANSVIRSVKRLSYEQAHALITEDDDSKILSVQPPENYETAFTGKPLSDLTPEEFKTLKTNVRRLWDIASTLRKKRMREGSFDLEMPEFKIFCNAEGYADRIEKIDYNESHQLIEEYMLSANEAVAKILFSNHLPYISRVHDEPDPEKLSELREELATFNVVCGDLTSRKEIIKVLAEIDTHPQNFLLKTKFLRSMKRAEYRASADGHYGLNKVYYAHFTSPIRRYADLTVHRNLDYLMKTLKMQGAVKGAIQLISKTALDASATHISETEHASAEAERESRKIKLMEFFEKSIGTGEAFEAVITSLSNHGFFVELTQSMAFGFVHIHTMHDDIYRLSDDSTELRGRSSGNVYRLGDKISVEVESIDRFKRQIDFHIANSATEKTLKKRNKRR
ncbi:MAG: RNB domain-containing ribonuclease [Opitutales bacterium]|nr:RNB domain-containing ribonuclease [Opitutales bacterium]